MSELTVGGLFSGVGGIELAFQQAGFTISWANEMDEKAHDTYKYIMKTDHYIGKDYMRIEDILSSDLKNELTEVDVLVAGFPCQAFSIAGYRKGFEDDRGNVFFRIIDVLNHLKETSELPKALLLENVKNFASHGLPKGKTYRKVKDELGELGYSVYKKILNTKDYTEIPQNRERTFMVCFRNERDWHDLSAPPLDEIFDYSDGFEQKYYTPELEEKCKATIAYDRAFRALHSTLPIENKKIREFIDFNEDDPAFFYTDGQYCEMLSDIKTRKDTFYQIRRVYPRENKSNVCPTLTANMGTGGHNVPIIKVADGVFRKLTPQECFKFQGYGDVDLPVDMARSHLYKQAGNSVSVPLIKIIAEMIKSSISIQDEDEPLDKDRRLSNVLQ